MALRVGSAPLRGAPLLRTLTTLTRNPVSFTFHPRGGGAVPLVLCTHARNDPHLRFSSTSNNPIVPPGPVVPPTPTEPSIFDSFDLGIVDTIQDGVIAFHQLTPFSWAADIILLTLGLRLAISMPMHVFQQKVLARVELLRPNLKEWAGMLGQSVVERNQKAGNTIEQARAELATELAKRHAAAFREAGLQPWKTQLPVFGQVPVWIALSLALRQMTSETTMLTTPALFQSLSDGGMLFFPDLTVPDSTMILPITLGIANLVNLELHTLLRPVAAEPSARMQLLTGFFRLLAVVMVPVAMNVPAAMALYWTTSAVYGLGQHIALRLPTLRRLLAIPKTTTELPDPFATAARRLALSHREFWAEVREKNR
eukprot:m.53377 g.53377  ORF g.53377 m.53377 type:complete len:369 (-) comp11823_c0_seq1:28-1134(-)